MRRLKVWWLKSQLNLAYRVYMEDYYDQYFLALETTGSEKQAERCANWDTVIQANVFNAYADQLIKLGVPVRKLEVLKP